MGFFLKSLVFELIIQCFLGRSKHAKQRFRSIPPLISGLSRYSMNDILGFVVFYTKRLSVEYKNDKDR